MQSPYTIPILSDESELVFDLILTDADALSSFLRSRMADVLAYLPAVRRSAEHTMADTACINGCANAALDTLRCGENLSAYAQLCEKAPAPKPFCLSGVLAGFACGAALLCPEAELLYHPAAHTLTAFGSEPLYTLCVGNLLRNSLMFAHEKPHVTLRLTVQGGNAVLHVHDSGTGILPQTLRQMFEPWMSADPYADGACAPGLGLGLALVQKYTAVYGGSVAVDSVFGEGCSVAFSVPCTLSSGTAPSKDFLQDRCSPLYTQLCGFCAPPW